MQRLFDETYEQLQREKNVGAPIARLMGELYENRTANLPAWRGGASTDLRRHRLYPVLLEDPFVRHSAIRPRGYPGDAELLDYIYGTTNVRPMIEGASSMGRRLYECNRMAPAAAAVRNRLRMAADETDRLARAGARPHVLSLACGHLREARCLQSLADGTLGRFVGVDQDADSLALVRREWECFGVEARQCDARTMLRSGIAKLGKFDFIYSLGLFDYLSDVAARRVLATLVDMLNPGGKVWVANFVDRLWCTGYMEAVMDWWLIYRSEGQLYSLADRIEAKRSISRRTFLEPERNVAFLEVTRQ